MTDRITVELDIAPVIARLDQLLRDAHRLKGIPGVIAHGRYDVVCPAQNAWDLHKAWPDSKLEFGPTSGHSAFEPELVDILVRATDSFR